MAEQQVLVAMRDTMEHRGPDDAGVFVDGALGLAHRRLSIVGLSSGHQPMSNSAGNLWIVFNGEIYNYPQLKRELQQKGYEFRTESDTEVIIHLYAEYGKDCVQHLNGMFAFAIWDRQQRQLFMARDRLGVKPFYYTEFDDAILFASEIKSLLAYPGCRAKCNGDAVYEYFLFRAVSGEQTLFEGVKSLLPGHYMTIKDGSYSIEKYWDHRQAGMDFNMSVADARQHLGELLDDAVRIRLMSEVPLGTFCSGGVDSSLVTALAARAIGQPVNTFSVGFHEAAFDETYYARMVSRQYGTTHHELKLDSGEFTRLLPDLIHLNDEPLNFSNSVHIYAISKLAKEFVTVVLTGEGADELFLGYPRYQIPRLAQNLKRLSWLAGPLLNMAMRIGQDHRLEKLSYYLNHSLRDVMLMNSATSRAESVTSVVQAALPRNLGYRDQVLDGCSDMDNGLSRLSLQDQQTYLVSILNRQDKMSMGASVEARVPFLDYRIAEFANSLPAATRMRGFDTKMLVKQVAGKYLPREVIYRRKSGFGVPLGQWFRDPQGLGGMAQQLIHDGGYEAYLDPSALKQLYRQHESGQQDHGEMLWTTINFLIWKQQFAA
jgi:asparagine synthase (glutamine-hydrolysing)